MKKDIKAKIIKEIKSLALTALVFVFITSALIEGSIVPTPSMENTILTGDRLFINKFVFGSSTPSYIPFTNIELPHFRLPALREPERNEIIVFRFPGELNQLKDDAVEFWVKRCVAIPGDTLEIRDKIIYVNGEKSPIPVNINYANPNINPEGNKNSRVFQSKTNWNEDNYGPIVLPKIGDEILLTPENIALYSTLIQREIEEDKLSFNGNDILIGDKMIKSYTITKNYYFMIGDNRDDSYDSRFWGFVPRENIVGTPMIIFWSWDSNIPFSKPFDLLSSVRLNRIAKIVR